ncbi:hypothetical protein [Paraburkholderia youngii]|uniref:Uncharacterized protein n=1 Tax=Paraburkholderia youngii TaxID=2782701 RepID=A0A7Y6JUC4_9BURK|nr:hypothetical protein [Paraburkholderia youngii]NUX98884.1 hypothetical protein [Paraburkholderia youngii]
MEPVDQLDQPRRHVVHSEHVGRPAERGCGQRNNDAELKQDAVVPVDDSRAFGDQPFACPVQCGQKLLYFRSRFNKAHRGTGRRQRALSIVDVRACGLKGMKSSARSSLMRLRVALPHAELEYAPPEPRCAVEHTLRFAVNVSSSPWNLPIKGLDQVLKIGDAAPRKSSDES